MRSRVLVAVLLSLASVLPLGPSRAADLGVVQALPAPTATDLADALELRATLYAIRAAFNVLDPASVPLQLASDAKSLSAGSIPIGPSDPVHSVLLAEGSYFIVSLRYLIEAGGANWPLDRAESSYEFDARTLLDGLLTRWVNPSLSGAEAIEIMTQVDLINAWTEGYPAVPAELDHFSHLDAAVATALEN